MKIPNLIEGTFKERPNRFTVIFEADRALEMAHLRDPGRLKELLFPGARLLLRPANNLANRKTKYDVIAVWCEDIWVLINSGFHSDLAGELIESGFIGELSDYRVEKREYTFGKSRIDFLLKNIHSKVPNPHNNEVINHNNSKVPTPWKNMLLEVKGCTLVEGGHARFPDAPTLRGKKHLEELIKAKNEGIDSAVLFIIPRGDAKVFSPNWEMDPDFSRTLKQAEKENVLIIAYSFTLNYDKKELELKPLKKVDVIVKPLNQTT
ncbi:MULTISPECIES: DNA/RNA nuclease SfsA [Methanobacterium]|uniref:Sugar fermentation stimulation protein homolog n=1 Tax=Methanobacterium subterraneum TaxID=59277 RepID=A0A2H4VF65_9EURY|nr:MULTISPECIES: DNA/RNA nuclease SfsA [Methanobacterium]MBW4256425.1 DNA/RNA nuclease SfsA [Methanobacterium sp. YSL]AUB56727.1 sugar fermentation stimulation protein SfsA [Methanobacterium subterraneum]AUB59092.1 sugar fermentation stimulation protein SfsA [Methanobacterium sp. MZ-A1]AUB61523.1 sugar fermentation stimulation protein SfsA [Methanobacterium subterraneum]NMO10406.1 DNA/RNA nuclease SfsA [Methanobacterium subterraneum]